MARPRRSGRRSRASLMLASFVESAGGSTGAGHRPDSAWLPHRPTASSTKSSTRRAPAPPAGVPASRSGSPRKYRAARRSQFPVACRAIPAPSGSSAARPVPSAETSGFAPARSLCWRCFETGTPSWRFPLMPRLSASRASPRAGRSVWIASCERRRRNRLAFVSDFGACWMRSAGQAMPRASGLPVATQFVTTSRSWADPGDPLSRHRRVRSDP